MTRKTTSTTDKGRKGASTAKGKQRFPPGWNEEKVRAVIAHYDGLTDEERAAEIDRAAEAQGETLVAVPTALLAAVQQLIKDHLKLLKRREKNA